MPIIIRRSIGEIRYVPNRSESNRSDSIHPNEIHPNALVRVLHLFLDCVCARACVSLPEICEERCGANEHKAEQYVYHVASSGQYLKVHLVHHVFVGH